MSRHCYVVNCSNGDYRLIRIWKGVKCDKHAVFHGDPPCDCDPPFRLFTFPGKIKAPEARQTWINAIKRADPKKPDTWLDPSRNQVVCSIHFQDGHPSDRHPYPELHLRDKRRKRGPIDSGITENVKRRLIEMEDTLDATEIAEDEPVTREMSPLGLKFIISMLMSIIKRLREENMTIKKEKEELIRRMGEIESKDSSNRMTQTPMLSQIDQKDSDVNYFPGIGTLSFFRKLQDFVAPFIHRRWRGMKIVIEETSCQERNCIPEKASYKIKSVNQVHFNHEGKSAMTKVT